MIIFHSSYYYFVIRSPLFFSFLSLFTFWVLEMKYSNVPLYRHHLSFRLMLVNQSNYQTEQKCSLFVYVFPMHKHEMGNNKIDLCKHRRNQRYNIGRKKLPMSDEYGHKKRKKRRLNNMHMRMTHEWNVWFTYFLILNRRIVNEWSIILFCIHVFHICSVCI